MGQLRFTTLSVLLPGLIGFGLWPLIWQFGEPAPHAATARLADRFVDDIIAGRNRAVAICRLVGLRRYYKTPRYEPEPCAARNIRELIASPSGPPTMYAAILESALVEDDAKVSRFAGELLLFDSADFLIPVYAGASLLEAADGIISYGDSQRKAIVHVIPTGAGEDATVQILHVVPIANPQRSVLSVILGPATYGIVDTCEGFYWSWRARDVDADGHADIEIGPNRDAAGSMTPRAVFRWSPAENKFVGPEGSAREGFMRTDTRAAREDCCHNGPATEFAKARAGLSERGEPGAVRRSRCKSGSVELMQAVHP